MRGGADLTAFAEWVRDVLPADTLEMTPSSDGVWRYRPRDVTGAAPAFYVIDEVSYFSSEDCEKYFRDKRRYTKKVSAEVWKNKLREAEDMLEKLQRRLSLADGEPPA